MAQTQHAYLNTTLRASQASQSPYKILVVEDDPVIQKVHQIFIEKLGYQVTTVGTGEEALAELLKFDYDAAVIDLGLPDITGDYVLSAVRKEELKLKKHTPIIIVTAHGDQDKQKECEANKADAFYSKPVSMDIFKRTLESLLPPKATLTEAK